MHSRRTFLIALTLALATMGGSQASEPPAFKGEEVFNRILKAADAGAWRRLPIGELMGKVAMALRGIPYISNTLELSADKEICCVNFDGLDCVTFVETTLAFACMLKKGGQTPADLLNEIALIRYRGGKQGDYSTRLHYMSDWFFDNEHKHIVQILSQFPGAVPFTQKVSFMSTHPHSYMQLDTNPRLVAEIKKHEDVINSRSLKYIPLNKIAAVEPLLQTGDIVGVCTSIPGLDIAHTGIVIRTSDGVAHFMDASSKTMKVTLEPGPISKSLNWSKNLTGAIFARPTIR